MDIAHALEIADEAKAGGYDSMTDRALIALAETTRANARYLNAVPMLIEAIEEAFSGDLTYLSGMAMVPAQAVVKARLALRHASEGAEP